MSDVFGLNDGAEQTAARVSDHLPAALEDVVTASLAEVGRRTAALREELHTFFVRLRRDAETGLKRTEQDVDRAERRIAERMHGVSNAIKIADLTRRNEELLRENQQLKRSQTEQQH